MKKTQLVKSLNTRWCCSSDEQYCVQTLSNHGGRRRRSNIYRQTIPDVGAGNRKGPRSYCRQTLWRTVSWLVDADLSHVRDQHNVEW